MARRKSFSSSMFRAARGVDDLESLASPSKLARRTKNVAVGRSAAKGGVFRRLFGGGRRKAG